MKRIEEQMTEIRRRRFVYGERKKIRRLAASAACMSLMLLGVMVFAPVVSGGTYAGVESVYGATILGPEIGGYVIVAILAFSLGIAVAILIQRKRNKKLGGMER